MPIDFYWNNIERIIPGIRDLYLDYKKYIKRALLESLELYSKWKEGELPLQMIFPKVLTYYLEERGRLEMFPKEYQYAYIQFNLDLKFKVEWISSDGNI